MTFTMETSANTVFVVSRLTGTTNARVLTAYYNNWLLGHWGGWVNAYYAEGWIAYNVGTADTVWRMYMGDWGGASNDVANAYSNGTSITNQATSAASAGPKGLGINFQGGEPSTCEAAEIIVFNRVLSATERKQVHTYLGQNWGISNTDRSIIDLSGNEINPEMSNTIFSPDNRGVINFNGKAQGTNAVSVIKVNTSIINRNDGQEITVSCWIKPLRTSGQYSIIATNRSNDDSTYNWIFYQHIDNGAISFHGDAQNKSTYVPTINQWINAVNTVTAGGVSTLYINGVSVFVANGYTYGNGTPSRLGIGADPSSAESFQGSIAQTLIYNRALSAVEVLQNYEALKSKFANTIIESGLVLNLDAGNIYSYAGAGTVWYDVTVNSYNGTLIGSPSYASTNNGGIIFDSVAKYVTLPASGLAFGTGQFAIEAWVFSTAAVSYNHVYSSQSSNNVGFISLYYQNGYGFSIADLGNSAVRTATTHQTVVSQNTWYHVVGIRNASNQYIVYVNGVESTTNSTSSYPLTATAPQIASNPASNTERFTGTIASFRLYNTSLSAAQVLQNYNATKGRFGL
jgi:hypothetical protein